MRRHELSAQGWYLIEPHTLGQPGTSSGTGRDNRLFVTAVFCRTRTGIVWRDLPVRFGSWNTLVRRFRCWALAGVWEALFRAGQEPDYDWVRVDSTTVKAPKAAAGQKKHGPRRMSRPQSRGFGPKVPAVVDALSNCLHWALTSAERADCPQPPALLAAVAQSLGAGVCDKAEATNSVLQAIADPGATPVIPPKSSRLDQRAHDRNLYADRNKIEIFLGCLKEARGFATRYAKTGGSFLATAQLLAALDWRR